MFPIEKWIWRLMLLSLVLLAPVTVIGAELNAQTPARLEAADLEIRYLESIDDELTLDDVSSGSLQFREVSGDVPSFGFSSSTYWFNIELELSQRDEDRWVLEISYPLLDQIELFVVSNEQVVSSYAAGDHLPFRQRPILDRSFSFPLLFTNQHESVSLYLKIKSSSSLQLPISLWRERAYFRADHNEQIWLGLYYGFLLAILLYNGLLARSIKDSVYVYYCGYVATYCMFQMAINGLGYEYFWPELSSWNERATPIFMAVCIAMAMMFARKFLQIDKHNFPKLNMVYLASIAAQIPLFFVGILADYLFAIQLLTATTAALGMLLLVTGFYVFMHQGERARFYLIAWTFFLIGVLIYAFKTWGLLPKNFFTEYAIQIGSASEMLLLSYALADRFKRIKDENEHFQKETAILLEKKVNERTSELQNALKTLSAANQSLERLSTKDSLTDVFNRAYFNQHFEYIWNAATRNEEHVSLLMIDIDFFKSINDTHGHIVGDAVIVNVAKAIDSELTRATDLLARYGGEEFIVVLPDTGLEGAVLVAERIRKTIAEQDFSVSNRTINATVSIGVSSVRPRERQGFRCLDLIELADSALYQAKNAGRNRIRFALSTSIDQPNLADDKNTSTSVEPEGGKEESRDSSLPGDDGRDSGPEMGNAA